MPGFNDVFGGQTLQPAAVAYRAVNLTANVTLAWPQYATDGNFVAGIMDVTPTGVYTITMPDATLVSPGQTVLWRNLGASSMTIADAAGGPIAVIASGAARLMWLTENNTTAGTWATVTIGVGSSSPDASQLAGYAVRAIGSTLNFAPLVTTISANYSVTSADRGKVFVWTGGTGTITLPALAIASSLSDWDVEVRNQGTGTLTIATTGGEQIDGSASLALNTTESCFVHSGPTAWYTVGRGRNTQFNFTKLSKSITGGTTTLSLTEASNVIQVYTGALVSNQTIIVPATVQVYYITNSTTGAFTLTVRTAVGGGLSVNVTQNATAVVYCDGTNVINCNTSGVTISAVSLAAGTAGAPSLNFAGDTATGIYQPSSGQFAIAISGTQRVLVTATGINNTAIGATTPTTGAFTTLSATSLNKVAVTAPATGSTLTIADGKTLTASNSVTLAGTDGSTVTFGTGGTIAYTANKLSVFAATTSAELATVISDETGTGSLVFANTPTLVTPVLGVASATTINKVAITAPAASATLTIANTKTLTVSNTVTLAGTDGATLTFGAGGTVVYTGSVTTSGLTQSTNRLLGRTTAATGAVEEISTGFGLSLSAGSLAWSAIGYGIVSGANFTTASLSLVDITGMSVALAANSTYYFAATVSFLSGSAAGAKFGVNYNAAGATVESTAIGGPSSSGSAVANRINAFNTATAGAVGISNSVDSVIDISGVLITGANAGNLTIQCEKASGGGTLTVYTGSLLTVMKVA